MIQIQSWKVAAVLQVGLSLFALITAGLFVREPAEGIEVNPGFITENMVLDGFRPRQLRLHRSTRQSVSPPASGTSAGSPG
jgi:hypothetical protein